MRDPVLASLAATEQRHLVRALDQLARRLAVVPWQVAEPVGAERPRALVGAAT